MRRRGSQQLLAGLLLVLALVAPCYPLALTTFGKSSPQNSNNNKEQNNDRQQPGSQASARECISDSECAGIKDATCLEDIFGNGGGDQKKRCLCGDYKGPVNGRCANESKRVKALCTHNDECTEGAICALGNDTSVIGKRCWCTQSYMEDVDKLCSGSPVALGFSALSVVAGLLLTGNV